MPFSYRLHEEAHQEFIEAYEWYELRQTGLGVRFMERVEDRLLEISDHPEYYGKHHGNYRQVKVEEFPYVIVYEFLSRKKVINILAIYHVKRRKKGRYRKMR
jgi:plasmid stabilization system protein ParE